MDIWLGTQHSLNETLLKFQHAQLKYGSLEMAVHELRAKMSSNDDDDEQDYNGYYFRNPVSYDRIGATAIIGVSGGTYSTTTNMTRAFGIPTYEDIKYRLLQAYGDPDVRAVMLLLDTPGGMAKGAFDLSGYISNYNESVLPVVSYTMGTMASAGVLYGTAAEMVAASQWADIGSVGAFAVFLDQSKMLEQMGIKAYVFRSAPFKGKPNSLEGIDDDGKEIMQEMIDRSHMQFVTQLSTNIGLSVDVINKTIANGKTFVASEALSLGLIQGIATYEKTLASMNQRYQNTSVATRTA